MERGAKFRLVSVLAADQASILAPGSHESVTVKLGIGSKEALIPLFAAFVPRLISSYFSTSNAPQPLIFLRASHICIFFTNADMAGLFGSSSSSTPTTGDLSKDVPISNPPEDSISDIAFSPAAEYLSASSWDGKVRIYEINDQGQSQGKAMITHEGPVLSTCWSKVSI